MSSSETASALRRVEQALIRRPDVGLHEDAPAQATLSRGTRVLIRHANGTEVETDMPDEFGGSGALPTPGWLFRAGLAGCATTSIAMLAAMRGVALSRLAVRAESRSDACGMFGLPNVQGDLADAAPVEMRLIVEIAAPDTAAVALRALVDSALERSPIPSLVRRAIRVDLRIETAPA